MDELGTGFASLAGMEIAIAGGTGVVGNMTARVANERGHAVRILSRGRGVDVLSGKGLAEAVAGADVVIDTLSVQTQNAKRATAFFTEATRALQRAEQAAGVGHHLALSIVGAHRVPYGYYAGKIAHEQAVEAGDVPWTILRATQFHEFAGQLFARAKAGPFHLAVRMRTQPIAVRDVATRLIELAEAGPAGHARDLAGPQEESMADMMRAWAAHHCHRSRMPAITLPGGFGRAMTDGSILPGPDADRATLTFGDWLTAQPV